MPDPSYPNYNIAPGMFIDWDNTIPCDMLMIDWRCDIDPCHTYWATHQFASSGVVDGYAGFQSLPFSDQSASPFIHRLIFSLWELNGLIPEIEYTCPFVVSSNYLFEGEGLGKHVYTDLPWQINTWYTMCLGVQNKCGKTFYYQWVKKTTDSEWFLCCVLSFPQTGKHFPATGFFMENLGYNPETRKCSVKNTFGRNKNTGGLVSRNVYTIKNSYLYVDIYGVDQHVWNVDHNYEAVTNSETTPTFVSISAGGNPVTDVPVSISDPYLDQFTLLNQTQSSSFPSFAPLIPIYIQVKNHNLYATPNNQDQLIVNSNRYYWLLFDSSDGYFYIFQNDKSKVLTLQSDQTTISLETYTGNDNQKWTKHSFPQSTCVYFTPKNCSTKSWKVSGTTITSGATISLSSHSTTINYQFITSNTASCGTIKSYYSSLYVAPSNSSIIQQAATYYWIFIKTSDDYYYILTPDCTKAITVPGSTAGNGANLILSTLEIGSPTQMWKLQGTGSGQYYLRPKVPSSMTMDIEGPSTAPNAPIQIWTHNTSASQFKWIVSDVQTIW